jgi:hypothetical protein
MSLSQSNSEFSSFDELENLGLLEDAIASATERRNIAQQNDCLPDLLDEEASAIMGGLSTISEICKPPITVFKPPIIVTIGIIAQDPLDFSS